MNKNTPFNTFAFSLIFCLASQSMIHAVDNIQGNKNVATKPTSQKQIHLGKLILEGFKFNLGCLLSGAGIVSGIITPIIFMEEIDDSPLRKALILTGITGTFSAVSLTAGIALIRSSVKNLSKAQQECDAHNAQLQSQNSE